jgi:oligoribonuclease NrnB/cAMP/cGMP phosphodiesterase (DHH superfamily)
MTPDICLYHSNCVDGFTAAWVVRQKFRHCQFLAVAYNEPPPLELLAGRNVLMVDFSYKRPAMDEIAAVANAVVVLDHHKTAEEELGPLLAERGKVTGVFDMTKAGALLAWEWTWNGPVPLLVQYVNDRDLWQFAMGDTRAIHAVMSSHPFDFDLWTALAKKIEQHGERQKIIEEGEAILRAMARIREQAVEDTIRNMRFGPYVVPVVNLPKAWMSEALNELAVGVPFAAGYIDRADGRREFSLRSSGEVDVSQIAKAYGGGGHRPAAGFVMPAGWEGDDDPEMDVIETSGSGKVKVQEA